MKKENFLQIRKDSYDESIKIFTETVNQFIDINLKKDFKIVSKVYTIAFEINLANMKSFNITKNYFTNNKVFFSNLVINILMEKNFKKDEIKNVDCYYVDDYENSYSYVSVRFNLELLD